MKRYYPFSIKTPIVSLDCIHFPLNGDWGYMMNYLDQSNWTQEAFYKGHNLLFDPEVIQSVQSMSFQDVEVYDAERIISIPLNQMVMNLLFCFGSKK